MSTKLKKLSYLRTKIMTSSQQLKFLTQRISESEDQIETQVLGGLCASIAQKIFRLNQQIAKVFKL